MCDPRLENQKAKRVGASEVDCYLGAKMELHLHVIWSYQPSSAIPNSVDTNNTTKTLITHFQAFSPKMRGVIAVTTYGEVRGSVKFN